MIHWNEYKQYKKQAEKIIEAKMSDDLYCLQALIPYLEEKVTKEQCIENLINALSEGQHFKNNPFYE